MPVRSTTLLKSAIVFSLMVDGSGSPCCRIFGRLRPVGIVRKRGAIHPLKRSPQRQANRPTGWARMGFGYCRSQVLISRRRFGGEPVVRDPLKLLSDLVVFSADL